MALKVAKKPVVKASKAAEEGEGEQQPKKIRALHHSQYLNKEAVGKIWYMLRSSKHTLGGKRGQARADGPQGE